MSNYVYYEPNIKGTDYICGDIHGCYDDLEKELLKINFDVSKDRLFSVGDLTDRGPKSELAFKYIDYDWFFPVMGNHEDMLIEYMQRLLDKYTYFRNGGDWVMTAPKEELRDYVIKIKELPYIIQVGEYGIIHSRLPENMQWQKAIELIDEVNFQEIILWAREEFSCVHEGIKKIYAGHTIYNEPKLFGNLEIIDTGAFMTYWGYNNHCLTIKKLGE